MPPNHISHSNIFIIVNSVLRLFSVFLQWYSKPLTQHAPWPVTSPAHGWVQWTNNSSEAVPHRGTSLSAKSSIDVCFICTENKMYIMFLLPLSIISWSSLAHVMMWTVQCVSAWRKRWELSALFFFALCEGGSTSAPTADLLFCFFSSVNVCLCFFTIPQRLDKRERSKQHALEMKKKLKEGPKEQLWRTFYSNLVQISKILCIKQQKLLLYYYYFVTHLDFCHLHKLKPVVLLEYFRSTEKLHHTVLWLLSGIIVYFPSISSTLRD